MFRIAPPRSMWRSGGGFCICNSNFHRQARATAPDPSRAIAPGSPPIFRTPRFQGYASGSPWPSRFQPSKEIVNSPGELKSSGQGAVDDSSGTDARVLRGGDVDDGAGNRRRTERHRRGGERCNRGAIPGVTVEATSEVLIERTRSVVTDGEGQYRFVDLRPGAYQR